MALSRSPIMNLSKLNNVKSGLVNVITEFVNIITLYTKIARMLYIFQAEVCVAIMLKNMLLQS